MFGLRLRCRLANDVSVSDALLLIVHRLIVGLGLWFVGRQLERSSAQPGLRAGVFIAALSIFVIAWLGVSVIGRCSMERVGGTGGGMIIDRRS